MAEKKDEKKEDKTSKIIPPKNLFKSIKKFNKKKLEKAETKVADIKPEKLFSQPKYTVKPNCKLQPKTLLIIDFQTNWYQQFKNASLSDGTPINIEQTLWADIDLESTSIGPSCIVDIKASKSPFLGTNQNKNRICKPDFLLIRNFPTDIHGDSFKNLLLGFMFAGLPSVNSLESVFFGMQRPLVYAACNKLGLPMVPMTYHPNFSARLENLLENKVGYPRVIKVASTHSGYGKIKVKNEEEMDDVKSILILSKDYYTQEKYINNIDFEYRIQKIGNNYRCFKRISSTSWKNNRGDIAFVDYKCEKKHIEWIEKASKIFGGLDLCALDVLMLKDGSEVILELNDTAIGLMYDHQMEDSSYIRDLVIDKMSKIYCK